MKEYTEAEWKAAKKALDLRWRKFLKSGKFLCLHKTVTYKGPEPPACIEGKVHYKHGFVYENYRPYGYNWTVDKCVKCGKRTIYHYSGGYGIA